MPTLGLGDAPQIRAETWRMEQGYARLPDHRILSVHAFVGNTHVVGDVAFVPSASGQYVLDGRRYSKPYRTDESGAQTSSPPVRDHLGVHADSAWELAPTKSVALWSGVQEFISCDAMLHRALQAPIPGLSGALHEFDKLVAYSVVDATIGLTGSLGLFGSEHLDQAQIHDYDFVVSAPLSEIARMVRALQDHTSTHPVSRLFEYGKGWRIRLVTRSGIICPFFRATDNLEQMIPSGPDWRVTGPVTIEGVVADASRGALMPSLYRINTRTYGLVDVVFPTLRARGDFATGDKVLVRGLRLRGQNSDHTLILVTDETQRSLLSPPWEPYYE